jgi:hypothetical protein
MHPSISRAALHGLFLPLLSLPLLCVSLLACAGPDDRGPSSPVAGAHRPGALILSFEPDGGMRRSSADGDARHSWQRDMDALRFEPIAGEYRARFDATARRPWTHAR